MRKVKNSKQKNKILVLSDRLDLRRLLNRVQCTTPALFSRAVLNERAGFYLPHELEPSHAAPLYFSSFWRIFLGEKINEKISLDIRN